MTNPVWYKVIEHRVNYDDYAAETVTRTVYRDYYFKDEANYRADELNLALQEQGYDYEQWYTVEVMD